MKKISLGGQAVIEGVMIRGPDHYVVAVRKNKRIITMSAPIKKIKSKIQKHKFLKFPFIRGVVNLLESLKIGMRSLMWSAEQQTREKTKITKNELSLTLLISIGAVILFFILLPYFLTSLIGITEEKNSFLFNFVDGAIRLLFFLIYLISISFIKDVKILFQYHGAEHKSIHCYERGEKLTLKNVKKFTTLHPRCGTSFLLIVFIMSIFIFSFLPLAISFFYHGFSSLSIWIRKSILFPLRILVIPIIVGISYELLKASGHQKNLQKNLLFRFISLPGLLLQKITTKEPNNKQIEVAIASLKRLINVERKH